jgi:hypothetical protein
MEKEIWKTIPGYNDYEVSDIGNVRSLKFEKVRGLEKCIVNGYFMVNLCKGGKRKTFHVHRLVAMGFLAHIPDGHNLVVDHINENPLDNRLSNLRIVTHRNNLSRRKRDLPTGVSWNKRTKKYRAYIQIDGKQIHLGYFSTPEEASEAYQKALQEITKKED